MSYLDKYLKYKTKYVELKQVLKGGSTQTTPPTPIPTPHIEHKTETGNVLSRLKELEEKNQKERKEKEKEKIRKRKEEEINIRKKGREQRQKEEKEEIDTIFSEQINEELYEKINSYPNTIITKLYNKLDKELKTYYSTNEEYKKKCYPPFTDDKCSKYNKLFELLGKVTQRKIALEVLNIERKH